jgi:hypothetical protein
VEADSVCYRLSIVICQGTAVIGPERCVARDHFEAWGEGRDRSCTASWCWCFLTVSVISDQFSRASAYLESRLPSRSLAFPQKYRCCGRSILIVLDFTRGTVRCWQSCVVRVPVHIQQLLGLSGSRRPSTIWLDRHTSGLGSGILLLPPANLCTCPETWSGASIGSILPVCTTLQASRQNA